jgi:hypothetical protein
MNRLILAAALAAGGSLVSAVPANAATRNYDCSKAGNANKVQCKAGAKAAPAASAAKIAATQAKANARAEKAQAKATAKAEKAAGVKPAAKTAAAAPPAKPSLLSRMSSMFGRSSTPAPAAKPAARRVAAAAPASVEDRNPAGAIAQCKDGTFSHAKARTGACSRHGGVGRWS